MSFTNNLDFLMQILPALFYATFCGALIGFERGRRGCAAGMKTQVFICVGSALFTMSAYSLSKDSQGEAGRMIAQIASGVGFIGAGAIMAKDRIIGLTTASIIWVMAGLGILAELGYGPAAVVISIGMILSIEVMSFIERKYIYPHQVKEQNLAQINNANSDSKVG